MSTHLELWAKSDKTEAAYPLVCHLLDSASAMGVIWDRWLRPGLRDLLSSELGGEAKSIAMYAASVHDIGKGNPVFAAQLASSHTEQWIAEIREKLASLDYAGLTLSKEVAKCGILRRHEQVSAATLLGGNTSLNQPAAESWLALTALGHHGRFLLENGGARQYRKHAQGKWLDARNDLIQSMTVACRLRLEDIPTRVSPIATTLISGLVVLADRIASQEKAITRARDDVRAGALDPERGDEWIRIRTPYFSQLVEETLGVYQNFSNPIQSILNGRSPRVVQRQALEVGDGLWFVMTATGSGKTETALLRHAQHDESLMVLLPTQATTNALMRRVEHVYAGTRNVASLAHGLASLEVFYQRQLAGGDDQEIGDGLFPTEFVRRGSGRLLAPVCVGTIDQALMGALPLKWTHLRLLALANSHVVIDEAHTMDHYQSRLLEPLLWWLGQTQTRVTILSATLPQWQRNRFAEKYSPEWKGKESPVSFPSTLHIPYPSRTVAGCQAVESSVETAVEMEPYEIALDLEQTTESIDAHVDWLMELRRQAPRARLGIIVNTIDRAQTIAKALKNGGEEVIVLHSRMTAEHRNRNAQRLESDLGASSSAEGITVVGTQAIEASLDIDLDALSTDLAPASSIIQRAGRVWRRNDPRRADRLPGVTALPVHIVRDTGTRGHLPYYEELLARTWGYLDGKQKICVPTDVQAFVETDEVRIDNLGDGQSAGEELSGMSRKRTKARLVTIDLAETLASDASFGYFNQLTTCANPGAREEFDEDPRTRDIEFETSRVIITDVDPEMVPGGWDRTMGELNAIRASDVDKIRSAVSAGLPVSGKVRRKLIEGGLVAYAGSAGALLGYLVGPLPSTLEYDPDLGLMEVGC